MHESQLHIRYARKDQEGVTHSKRQTGSIANVGIVDLSHVGFGHALVSIAVLEFVVDGGIVSRDVPDAQATVHGECRQQNLVLMLKVTDAPNTRSVMFSIGHVLQVSFLE